MDATENKTDSGDYTYAAGREQALRARLDDAVEYVHDAAESSIPPFAETISLAQAGELAGRDPSGIWRWAREGLRVGRRIIRLRTVCYGKRLRTTKDWLQQFLAELSTARQNTHDDRSARSSAAAIPPPRRYRRHRLVPNTPATCDPRAAESSPLRPADDGRRPAASGGSSGGAHD